MPTPIALARVEERVRGVTAGPVTRTGDPDLLVHGMTGDSRSVLPGCLFACVPGASTDGHRFAATAAAAGAAALVVQHPVPVDLPQLVVPSVRAVLGPVGSLLAGDPSSRLRLVGVTGSNGKTTTSTLVHGIVGSAEARPGLVTTVGARVGRQARSTTLTTPEAPELHETLAWMLAQGARSAVVEASSIAVDMGRLDALAFDVAVFTGFEEDHLDHHDTIEHYWASKARLFEPSRAAAAVVVVDDPWGHRLADQARIPVTRVGTGADADVRVLDWRSGAAGTQVLIGDRHGTHLVQSPLVGQVHVSNLAAAWATGRLLGVPATGIVAGLASAAPPPGRNTVLRRPGAPLVVVDYAHTPGALSAALATARSLCDARGCVHLVLGARGRRDRYKRQGLGAAARGADRVWLTNEGSHGEDPAVIIAELRVGLLGAAAHVGTVLDRGTAISAAIAAAAPGDVVLVVGRGHETWLQDGLDPRSAVHFDDVEVASRALADTTAAQAS